MYSSWKWSPYFAGPPEAPTNCSVVNQTTDSLEVECLPAFDGGLQQYFGLEVTDLQSGILLANFTDSTPAFQVFIRSFLQILGMAFPMNLKASKNSSKSRKECCFFTSPFFSAQVSGLNSGRALKITIYAANANGRSSNIVLEGFTLKVAELQLGKPRKKSYCMHFFYFDILQYVIFILSIRNVIFSQR